VGGIPSVLSEISKRNIAYALAHDSEEVRNEALQHKDFGKILKDKQLFHEVRTNFMKPERKNTALAIYNHPDFNAKDLEYDILNSVHDEIRSNPRGFGAIKAFDDDFIAKVARDTDEIERRRVRNRFRMEG